MFHEKLASYFLGLENETQAEANRNMLSPSQSWIRDTIWHRSELVRLNSGTSVSVMEADSLFLLNLKLGRFRLYKKYSLLQLQGKSLLKVNQYRRRRRDGRRETRSWSFHWTPAQSGTWNQYPDFLIALGQFPSLARRILATVLKSVNDLSLCNPHFAMNAEYPTLCLFSE